MKRFICFLTAVALLCCSSAALAYTKNSDGLYVDSSGNVIDELWDEAGGLYIVNGVGYSIVNADEEEPSSGVQQNEDGSITVESGTIQSDDPSSSGESGHLTQSEWAARWAKYTAANGTTTGTVYLSETGEAIPAEILALGLGRSTIRINKEKLVVPTASLRWDTEAPKEKALAVVTLSKSPKLSYVTLRAKKSQKSFVMGHCNKGRVLRVISTGKTWTMVDDAGIRGYVLTSGLTFYENTPRNYAAGIITVKGKTPSGNYVHVRTSPSGKSGYVRDQETSKAVEYPVGTPITVFAKDEKWCEIDVEGFHCYILTEFVTLQEPLVEPEPEQEPEEDPQD